MTLIGSEVVEDIARYYEKLQKDLDEVGQKSIRNFVTDAQDANEVARKFKTQMKGYEQQIANYKLTVQNDTEVIYKLFIQRNVFKLAIQEFLEKVDENTKQLFLETLNNMKLNKENDQEYKDKWWKYVNQNNFTCNLLWEVKNPDKIDYTPGLYFPDVTKK